MKAWTVPNEAAKSIDALRLLSLDDPKPEVDELLVKVRANGLNPVDYKLVQGGVSAWTFPHVLGLDAAGVVVAVGSRVQDFRPGDRVFFHGNLSEQGSFASLATIKANVTALMPDQLTFSQAAAILCGAMTAYQAIYRKASLANRRTALIHAGAGGVGSIAIQLAKLSGLKVLTTVSAGKADFVTALKPDVVIDYRQEDVTKAVLDHTDGLGADLIVNSIGTKAAEADLQRLAYNGALVTIDGQPEFDSKLLADRGIGVYGLNLGGAHNSGNSLQQHDLAVMATDLTTLVAAKKLDPLITQTLPFDQLPLGLKALQARETRGKIVVTWP